MYKRQLLGPANGGSRAYVLCTLSGRTFVHADSRAVFSVSSLVPGAPLADLRAVEGITARPTAPSFLPRELSTATSAVVGTDQLGYEMLDELGLTLCPEDVAMLMGLED